MDTGDIVTAHEKFSAKLDDLRKRWLGTFSTRLLCNCGKATISDHATDPDTRQILGFHLGAYQLLVNFAPEHNYWCDVCGAVYKTEVIEGIRKYVPLERTAAEQELHKAACRL